MAGIYSKGNIIDALEENKKLQKQIWVLEKKLKENEGMREELTVFVKRLESLKRQLITEVKRAELQKRPSATVTSFDGQRFATKLIITELKHILMNDKRRKDHQEYFDWEKYDE